MSTDRTICCSGSCRSTVQHRRRARTSPSTIHDDAGAHPCARVYRAPGKRSSRCFENSCQSTSVFRMSVLSQSFTIQILPVACQYIGLDPRRTSHSSAHRPEFSRRDLCRSPARTSEQRSVDRANQPAASFSQDFSNAFFDIGIGASLAQCVEALKHCPCARRATSRPSHVLNRLMHSALAFLHPGSRTLPRSASGLP